MAQLSKLSKFRSLYTRVEARLRTWPAPAILALGLSFIGVIALLKLTVGRGAPVVDFFLIPVAFVGWHARSRYAGYVAAVIAAGVSVHLTMVDNPNALVGPTIVSAGPRLILYFVILSLLGHARRTQGELECLAGTDSLTGALNVRTFAVDAQRELERSRRTGSSLSLLCLDIDDFKAINDTGGHIEGDRVLREVGSTLRRSVRSSDIVARLGGDEFVVLMPETGAEAAACAAARLERLLQEIGLPGGDALSCSMGLISFLAPPASLEDMLRPADELMYEAKAQGKGRIVSAVHEAAATA